MDKASFAAYLDAEVYRGLPDYVRRYQDVEYLDLIGDSESSKTWESIKDLIDWRGRKVADLACFLGYFSFKAARLGARVVGFDQERRFLNAARLLNDFYGLNVGFREWRSGQPISAEFEIALCLNALHHFPRPKEALDNIAARRVVFLVKNDAVGLVESSYVVKKKLQSHRQGRVILYAEKRISR